MITYGSSVNPSTGWIMGYLEKNDQVYFFTTNLKKEGAKENMGVISREITINILTEVDLIH